jgi:Transglutaminase-like superfamily/TgpA N-terminal domain
LERWHRRTSEKNIVKLLGLPTRDVAMAGTLAALGALPGLVMATILPMSVSVGAGVGSAVTGAITALAVARKQITRSLVGYVVSAIGVVLVVAAAMPGPAFGQRPLLAAVLDALARGWSTVVLSPVPADVAPRMLVPLALLCWVAAAAGVAIVQRFASLAGLLAPALGLLLASVAAGRHARTPALAGWLFVALCGAFLLVNRPKELRRSRKAAARLHQIIPAVGLLTIAGLVGTVASRTVVSSARTPFDLRDHVNHSPVPENATNPLDLVAARRRAPDQPMFQVKTRYPIDTRLLALERFDGVHWTTSATYRLSGSDIAAPVRSAVSHQTMRADISVSGLNGPWLPSIGDPTRLSGVGAFLDDESGSLVAASGESAGTSYAIRADVVDVEQSVIQTLPVDAEAAISSTLPPGMPAELITMANVATNQVGAPYEKALFLESYLKGSFDVNETAASGQSYGHLARALLLKPTDAARPAVTREQFALAFAVLGRAVGLPTRVVVGFGPGVESSPGVFEVTGADAMVWPEVKFQRVGWVRFNPAPTRNDGAGKNGSGEVGATFIVQEAVATGQVPTTIVPKPRPAPRPPTVTNEDSTNWLVITLLAGCGVLLVVLVSLATIIALKRRKSSLRRRVGTPREQVLGAWHDVLDRMVEIGIPQPSRRTVDELVEYDAAMAASLSGLYRPVNQALYSGGDTVESSAAQAWKARDRFVRHCNREVSATRRFRYACDPRPLLGSSFGRSPNDRKKTS